MKILSADQLKELDRYTIEHEPIASSDLIERAAEAFCKIFSENTEQKIPVKVFCGPGNNGADGLAIARLLCIRRYAIEVYVVGEPESASPDFKLKRKQLRKILPVHEIGQRSQIPDISSQETVIDALFGLGLNRPVGGIHAELISAINKSGARVVAVDIPSGLYCDRLNDPNDAVVCADLTVTFQLPKLTFVLPETGPRVGEFIIVDIGLHRGFIEEAPSVLFYSEEDVVKNILKKRAKFSYKGTYGHALLVAGSRGKTGAAVLAAKACMRAGVGLLTVGIPDCGRLALQTALPEAMLIDSETSDYFSAKPDLKKYTAVGLGPGLGTYPELYEQILHLFETASCPLVVDADALNLMATYPHVFEKLPAGSILTPHIGEFDRLTKPHDDHLVRIQTALELSVESNVYIILKGAYSCIVTPAGNVYFNATGNPGMATAGSGDVLTGVVTALSAQGYAPEQAAILGVWLHGLAGDLAAREKGQIGMIASDIIDQLPNAYMHLVQ